MELFVFVFPNIVAVCHVLLGLEMWLEICKKFLYLIAFIVLIYNAGLFVEWPVVLV